ncbi:RILP-like protein homolog isoform X3 [Anopheles darlingi]|uniref:Putative rab n=1 Tax=Anopheles darlingi TaxID=43151 RepID=A0A2M4CX56_ANODA|nr:RILP-like protein homolog isoform X3 [Anopheles darlingi]
MNVAEKLTVVDVYDLALEIGKEFEIIIDANGANAVSGLITKVVNALELMETLTCQNESENSTIQELQEKIVQLEAEKEQKAASRSRYEKELEAIEDQWRLETKELFTVIDKLQEENRKLQRGLAQTTTNTPGASQADSSSNAGGMIDEYANGLNGLEAERTQAYKKSSEHKLQLSQLEEKLKRQEIELYEKKSEIEALSCQNDRLKKVVSESRRRQKLSHNQIITLCEERADFLAQIQDQHHEIKALRNQLGLAEQENQDLVNLANEDERPRFSTIDLKEMLTDRNELKARVSDLEQELMTCQAVGGTDVVDASSTTRPVAGSAEQPPDDFSELPVQGPLPYEPDDAPWKKSNESGIRKFFRKLFNESSSDCATFSQRSLSTLSKMALSSGPHSDIPI